MPKVRGAAVAGLVVMSLITLPVASAARDRAARMVTDTEAPAYAAIGRLNVAGNRHCTATLIGERLVLTAAHCLFNSLTGHRARPEDIRFVAGQRGESHAALRGVTAAATLPGYAFQRLPDAADAATDLALLQLDAAVSPDEALPLPVGDWDRRAPVSLVGFGRDRAYIASIRADCLPQDANEALVVLDCPVVPGVSGAPALRAGSNGPVVVGVVSAGLKPDGFAVTVIVTPQVIEVLKQALLGTPT